MGRNRNLLGIAVLLQLSFPRSEVLAQEIFLTPGQPPTSANGVYQNVSLPLTARMNVSAGRSYCCLGIADNDNVRITQIVPDFTVPEGANATVSSANRGDYEPVVAGQNGPSVSSRVCFEPPVPNPLVPAVRLTINSMTEPTFNNFRITCDETTLYGSYNTAAGEFNFLEITNRANGVVNVTVRGYSEPTGGDKVIEVSLPIEPVGGGGITGAKRVDLDIHSRVTPGAFGALVITHDGPPGSIAAALSQYKITSVSPFDFTLVGRVPFEASSK
jgi:hypothetical protein